MNLNQRTTAFVRLGNRILESLEGSGSGIPLFNQEDLFGEIKASNPWFSPENTRKALSGIVEMLHESTLIQWLDAYPWLDAAVESKRPLTAIIMAGNIPAVGFHDLLCALLAGHDVLIRLSSKDRVLPVKICNWLIALEPQFRERIKFSEGILAKVDAVIATGSNNTGRYFEHYFGKTLHLFRKSRYSLAILDGKEEPDTLTSLAGDIFTYFGMGCRNVSRLFIPEGYDLTHLIPSLETWCHLGLHSKYFNNYEYNKAIALINQEPFLDGGFFLLKQSPGNHPPPLAVIYFSFYKDRTELLKQIDDLQEDLQCVVHDGRINIPGISFGQTQIPGPSDYADGVDTMGFLRSVQHKISYAQ